ncbi:MAG: hypothetical protein GY880_26555 [Planctomycetaceae bacterium]|nr:hypothetical protein [Planctomycetaceae bacterium]
MKIYFELILVSIVTVMFAGCSNSTDTGPALSKAKVDPAPYLLAAEPEGGLDVIAARESAKNDDSVVVVGRVGGGLNPWVESRAAFQIVDPSILACSDETPEGETCACKTPWDYCCETDKLPNAMALVRFEDNQGKVVLEDARNLFGIKELQTVVVKGIAKRDEVGNLTVIADGIYLRN